MEAAVLDGVIVLELSLLEGAQFCGRTLASLGADVVKVETLPGGDPLRQRPPLHPSSDGTLTSIPYEHLNQGKRSIAVDPTTAHGRSSIQTLLETADVVIVSPLERVKFAIDAIPAPAGQLRVHVGAFGGRSREDAPSSAFSRLHSSTSGYLIPVNKDGGSRPAWPGPYAFESMFGVAMAVAVLAERTRGIGGEIDFSYQAHGVWMDKILYPQAEEKDLHRYTADYAYGGVVECADGYGCTFVLQNDHWPRLCALLDHLEWLEDPDLADAHSRALAHETIDSAIRAWCRHRAVDDVIAAFRAADITVGRVRSPELVIDWDLLRERDFFAEGSTAFGSQPVSNLPFGGGLRAAPLRRAPWLGEHNDEVLMPLRAQRSARRAKADPSAQREGSPFRDLRVLDLTWAIAGPAVTSTLAFLGADVVKVESSRRPDITRLLDGLYTTGDVRDLNASPGFHAMNAGKRSIELDLSTPHGREIALSLALSADVIVENMRPGKIAQMGLAYEKVAALNPSVVMCSLSSTGVVEGLPVPGYAPVFWAEGGGAWFTGWPEDRPGLVRIPVDSAAASWATLGVMALLERRESTGRGGYIDCSAIETVVSAFGVELLHYAIAGADSGRRGNSFPGTIVNDVFPCFGDDEWLAVTISSRRELYHFADVVDLSPEVCASVEAGIDPARFYNDIAEATRHWDASRLEGRLAALDVPAARSLSLRSARTDSRLSGRRVWQPVKDPRFGSQAVVGLPWTFNGGQYEVESLGPDLGGDTADVLQEWGVE